MVLTKQMALKQLAPPGGVDPGGIDLLAPRNRA
jgi:hypothetical protein